MVTSLALVAPYKELAELSKQVCRELEAEVTVAVGDHIEGVRVARKLVADGADVIISRGGTATGIAYYLDVPVVEIIVNAFDLVRALADARSLGNYIGIVGFRNVIYGTKSMESVLGIKIEELFVETEEDVVKAINNAKKSRIDVIVGDAMSYRLARELSMESILVTSGKEAIGQAIREAREVALVRNRERSRAEQFKTILDFAYDGIVATDKEGCITLINPAAEKLLNLESEQVVGCLAKDALPNVPLDQALTNGEKCLGELHRAGNSMIVAKNIVPVKIDKRVVGAVAIFQDISYLQAVETKVRKELYLKGHTTQYTFKDIIARSPKMLQVIERAKQYANTEATILITGETGTGKEMVAQSIHNVSLRREGPFVAINCAAVPENLMESELFGYEEGAFTGARKGGKKGLFELAHRGTLFLDEIGELSLSLQASLLRVLQQKAIMRVGGDRVIPVNVRIIAATHRNLEEAIFEGIFRHDLYYRLNVLHLKLPSLRERLEDLPVLINILGKIISKRSGRRQPYFSEEIISRLQSYNWPGNVRQLENILERLIILCSGQEVRASDLDEIIRLQEEQPYNLQVTLKEREKAIIRETLELTGYDKDETCKRLGISKTTLWRRLKNDI